MTYGLESLDLHTAATTLAYRGWRVFPVDAESKVPLVKDWPNVATTDARQVNEWWKRFPAASIGYPTGLLTVVEIDGETGLASMEALRATNPWPPTLTSVSGRGLHHFYVPTEPLRNCVGMSHDGKRGLGKGIDVRSDGGFVILPPSVHRTGRRYRWGVKIAPVPMPDWMTERLRSPEPSRLPIPATDADRYAQAALAGELENIYAAGEGELNHAVNKAAWKLGRHVAIGALEESETFDALVDAAVAAGHPASGAAASVRSGLTAGMRRA